ncbi:MAG: DNA gyrase subunit A [Candidatus Paceibacterota bacterium]
MARKKKDDNNKEEEKVVADKIVSRSITDEMKEAYIDYAMSVITARALPDVRDGLKPVHRRILFAMNKMGLTSGAKFKKSAAVVGDVIAKYHPHGDAAVYDTMVKMAQDFNHRYPLISGQGNFGSIDGDSAAAYRYTEAKMTKISEELLADINKETVDMVSNYDGTHDEPEVLPAAVPGLLLNGTLGIAVGMATNIPPHNLGECIDATTHLIDNPDATTEDLMEYIKAPDFPTGAVVFDREDILHAYSTGRGGMVVRGEAEIVEPKAGSFQIIIRSIPYRVNKENLVMKIADLVKDKKLEGIRDIRDESTRDIRIAIDLKTGSHPQKTLNKLYKYTQLEEKFHMNLVALVDGVPQMLSLKAVLQEFVKHRQNVVRRRAEYELKKAQAREHILLGLKKALDHIDEVIKIIRESKDRDAAKENLMKKFKFSSDQTDAILAMQLQRLAGLERQKIEDELKEIQKFIKELEELLSSEKNILAQVKEELEDMKDKYGDARRTTVVEHGVRNISMEDMIPEVESVLVYTAGGYVKRTDPSSYKRQKRGGVGVVDLNTKEEDVVTHLIQCSTHSDLLFFTDKGKVYQIKMYELPEGRRATKGKSIMNFLSLEDDEKVTTILPMPKNVKKDGGELDIVLVTESGTVKKVEASSFHDVRRGGIIAITLKDDDNLVAANFADPGEDVVLVTRKGKSIRFSEEDVRAMGRTAQGVRGIKLGKGDAVISGDVVHSEDDKGTLFVLSENGYGKKTKLTEYKSQNRGGSGLKTANVTKKTGELVSARILSGEEAEMVAMSQKSQVIRIDVEEIPSLGRATQGVRIMKLRSSDKVASLACL